MDVIEQLTKELKKRGWSEYRLAKESQLPQSTIANIFHRNTIPSIPTLQTICEAFGMSLSDFFSEDEHEPCNPLKRWDELCPEQKNLIQSLVDELVKNKI